MQKDETWFWSTEPRIVINLVNEKKRIDKERMKAQSFYIACCVWGKNPEEYEPESEKEIPGIDKPVDPSLLKNFYM